MTTPMGGRYWARTSDPQLVDAGLGVTAGCVLFCLVPAKRLSRRVCDYWRPDRWKRAERALPRLQALARHWKRCLNREPIPIFDAALRHCAGTGEAPRRTVSLARAWTRNRRAEELAACGLPAPWAVRAQAAEVGLERLRGDLADGCIRGSCCAWPT